MVFNGKVGKAFSEMEVTSENLDEELNDLENYGTYSGSVLEFKHVKTAIADRDFMYQQMKNTVLTGMPTTVKSVQQITEQIKHLSSINSEGENSIGVFSKTFENFGRITGQVK